MTTLEALSFALFLLPRVTVGVEQLIHWIVKLRSALQQTGEWTPAHEAQWRAGLLTHHLRPEEIPDALL